MIHYDEKRRIVHYELFFFYIAGYRAKDVIREFGYRPGTAYRFHRVFRQAKKRARDIIGGKISVSSEQEKIAKNLDDSTT